jgi:hypothetical protein
MITPQPADPEPFLRFRLFVAGTVADEDWIDTRDPSSGGRATACAERQRAAALAADAAGQLWMVEVYNPSEPSDAAYFRFGTDPGGMVAPFGDPADPFGDPIDALLRLWTEP